MDVKSILVADAAWGGEMVTVTRTVTAYGASVVAVTTATEASKANILILKMTAATPRLRKIPKQC